jgi:hypothetical protein
MRCRALVSRGRISDWPTCLAQHAFSHVAHGNLGVLHVKKISHRLLKAPEDGEADIDDVLIAGQHRALFSHIGHATAESTNTHSNNILPRNFGQIHLIDRIRQTEVQAGWLLAHRLAEAQDYAKFIWVHTKGEGMKTRTTAIAIKIGARGGDP